MTLIVDFVGDDRVYLTITACSLPIHRLWSHHRLPVMLMWKSWNGWRIDECLETILTFTTLLNMLARALSRQPEAPDEGEDGGNRQPEAPDEV